MAPFIVTLLSLGICLQLVLILKDFKPKGNNNPSYSKLRDSFNNAMIELMSTKAITEIEMMLVKERKDMELFLKVIPVTAIELSDRLATEARYIQKGLDLADNEETWIRINHTFIKVLKQRRLCVNDQDKNTFDLIIVEFMKVQKVGDV